MKVPCTFLALNILIVPLCWDGENMEAWTFRIRLLGTLGLEEIWKRYKGSRAYPTIKGTVTFIMWGPSLDKYSHGL